MTDNGINTDDETDLSFGKQYKLCSRKKIAELFEAGKITKNFPVKALWQTEERAEDNEDAGIQAAFSVPKKAFRRAHDRNRIKRMMRESFRLNRKMLEQYLNENNKRMYLFIIYQEKKELTFDILERKMIKLINQLINHQENEAL